MDWRIEVAKFLLVIAISVAAGALNGCAGLPTFYAPGQENPAYWGAVSSYIK